MNYTEKIREIERAFAKQRDILEVTRYHLASLNERAHLLPERMQQELRDQNNRNARHFEDLDADCAIFEALSAYL